jgi:hypothetical protein
MFIYSFVCLAQKSFGFLVKCRSQPHFCLKSGCDGSRYSICSDGVGVVVDEADTCPWKQTEVFEGEMIRPHTKVEDFSLPCLGRWGRTGATAWLTPHQVMVWIALNGARDGRIFGLKRLRGLPLAFVSICHHHSIFLVKLWRGLEFGAHVCFNFLDA